MGVLGTAEILTTLYGAMALPTDLKRAADLRSLLIDNPDWALGATFADAVEDEVCANLIFESVGIYSSSRQHRSRLYHGLRRRVGKVTPVLVRLCADLLLDGVHSPGAVLRHRLTRIATRAGAPISRSRQGWTTKEMLNALRLT